MQRVPFEQMNLIRIFDDTKAARKYARNHGALAHKLGRRFTRTLKESGFEAGRILDAGCGPGGTVLELAAAFPKAEAVGADLSAPLLEMAQANAEAGSMTGRVSFVHGDVQALPFADGSFDVVVSVNVLHVVSDPVAMLKECRRVLSADGLMLHATLRRSLLGRFVPIFRTAYTKGELEALAQEAGLSGWRVRPGLMWLWLRAGPRSAEA